MEMFGFEHFHNEYIRSVVKFESEQEQPRSHAGETATVLAKERSITMNEQEKLLEQIKALQETDRIWLLSFLDFWKAHPKEADAFLDLLRKDLE